MFGLRSDFPLSSRGTLSRALNPTPPLFYECALTFVSVFLYVFIPGRKTPIVLIRIDLIEVLWNYHRYLTREKRAA